MHNRHASPGLQHPLTVLAAVLVCSSLVFLPLSAGSLTTDAPEVAVPLVVSLGIAAYAARMLRADPDGKRVERIAKYGWTGAVVAAVGISLLTVRGMGSPVVSLLFDEALTVVTVGSGVGLLVGTQVMRDRGVEQSERGRVLAETVWTREPGPTPVLTAVVTQLAELEDVDQLELDPLYEHVDPDVFERLRAQGDSQWQLRFYVDDYEVRVSGHGAVTVYDTTTASEGFVRSRRSGR